MSKEIISSELLKENPDWLLISNVAKQLHEQSGSNPLNLKKGSINFMKVSDFNVDSLHKELNGYLNSDHYTIIAHYNTVKFNKWLKSNPDLNSKYHIVITTKTSVIVNANANGYDTSLYKVTIYNKWKKKDTKFSIKGNGVHISFLEGRIRQELRDRALNNLGILCEAEIPQKSGI